jgi:hypothetical protein
MMAHSGAKQQENSNDIFPKFDEGKLLKVAGPSEIEDAEDSR